MVVAAVGHLEVRQVGQTADKAEELRNCRDVSGNNVTEICRALCYKTLWIQFSGKLSCVIDETF